MRLGWDEMKLALSAVLIIEVMLSSLPLVAQDSKAKAGEDLFKSHCVLCHGEDASANTTLGKTLKARNLHSAEVQKRTDSDLKKIITKGNGNMPPFASQLTGIQIDELVAYVRQLRKSRSH